MRPPEFWQHDGAAGRLLAPLGAVYAAAGRWRRRHQRPVDPGVPVVCVGNVTAGGTGKTPAALALAALLAEAGRRVAFVSRGHGGRERGPLGVDPARHDAAAVGDEPLLLAARAPTWIARDRAAGARAAVAAGADAIVLDDGHQNGRLVKRLSLLVVDAGYGIGNGRVHPAGPLREPWHEGLARADALLLVDPADGEPAAPLPPLPADLPVLQARLEPLPDAMALAGQRVLAFAGIGRPAKFFATLSGLGAEVAAAHAFADHHRFAPEQVMALVEEAHALGALPVTTEKDHVRLPAEARAMVRPVRVELVFRTPDRVADLLARALRDG